MSKKHFIALADSIRTHNLQAEYAGSPLTRFTPDQLEVLASFCRSTNNAFLRDRWFDYINGECGPNGGKVVA